MKIAVLGAGGVGGYVGARLAAHGNDVTFLARGAHAAAWFQPARAAVALARNVIAAALGEPRVDEPPHPGLDEPGACFVTVHGRDGALRGCIGRLEPEGSLRAQLESNARRAAFGDPRFPPLQPQEWPGLRIEVSLLGPLEELPAADEATALAALRPGVDGVVLNWRGHQATFLPQVWRQLPTPEAFVAALKRKAGLASDFWSPEMQMQRYTVHHHETQA